MNGKRVPGTKTAFVPVFSNGQLMLGIVGHNGFGCCTDLWHQLFGVFSYAENSFTNVAGFEFYPSGYIFDFAQIAVRSDREVGESKDRVSTKFSLPGVSATATTH
jgi:hypothetical protein